MFERRLWLSATSMRWVVVLLLLIALELWARSGLVSRNTFVAPTAMVEMLLSLGQKGALWPHLSRTLFETGAAFSIATVIGIPLGIVLSRFPYLARITEPYLTALYALPLVFFYPLLLALLGLGAAPIIVIATLMAAVPIIVNTRIGLVEVRDIYRWLARSVGCSPIQLYRLVLFPAAAPLVFAGLKMGFVYALIGSVAMEFVLTDTGLGFAVRYNYNFFNAREMYAFVLLILVIATAANAALLRGESAAQRGPM